MKRLISIFIFLLLISYITVLPAYAETLDFEGIGQVGTSYDSLGITFTPNTQNTCGGMGSWGIEGTNGSRFLCFNGINPGYNMELNFASPQEFISLDASRSNGSSEGDQFTITAYDGTVLLDTQTIIFGPINNWTTITINTSGATRITWSSSGNGFHPYGVDNLILLQHNPTKIYFSHIAINDGWETEVAVLNPTSKTITGNFTFYDTDGNQLGESVSKTLNPHGRYQVEVGDTFGQRGNIEYMIFMAPTYGLKGYSKFYNNHDGIRASIMASAPQKTGLFTKIDHEGWTGIAFINTAPQKATIELTAYSDAGEKIAIVVMDVEPGEKVVETATNIFAPQSISGASYVSFTSNQEVVGFFLNGSLDKLKKLDGSMAQ